MCWKHILVLHAIYDQFLQAFSPVMTLTAPAGTAGFAVTPLLACLTDSLGRSRPSTAAKRLKVGHIDELITALPLEIRGFTAKCALSVLQVDAVDQLP